MNNNNNDLNKSMNSTSSYYNDLEEGLLPLEQPKLIFSKSEPILTLKEEQTKQKKEKKQNEEYKQSNEDNNNDNNDKNDYDNYDRKERPKSTSELYSSKSYKQKKNQKDYKVLLWDKFNSSFPSILKLTRQVSVPVCYCKICLENHPDNNCFNSSNCNFNHRYCRDSISTFIETCINDGNIIIRCPGYGECQGIFTDAEIKDIVSEEVWLKYFRFKEIKENPHYRECPFCNQPTIGHESTPEIICEKCNQKYCYFHANAHPNIPCHQYTREQLHTQMKSMMLIKTTTRSCPECGVATEKNGGCNHMTCHNCSVNWCWLCGRVMGENHFDDPVSGCPGGQFIQAPSFALWTIFPCLRWSLWFYFTRFCYYLSLFILLILIILLSLISAIFGIACLPISLPIYLYTKFMTDYSTRDCLIFPPLGLLFFLGFLILLVLELLWLLFSLVLSIVLYPIHLLTYRQNNNDNDDTARSYWYCFQDDELSPFWCFPLVTLESMLRSIFPNDD